MVPTDIRRKLVVVGDGACGKTCLLMVFAHDEFPVTYVPTIFDTYVQNVEVSGRLVQLLLWDTAGQEELDSIRTLLYPDTHVALVCFNVDSQDALANVEALWMHELKHHLLGVPFLLVCTKADLRNDPGTIERLRQRGLLPVLLQAGQAMAQRIGAAGYYECLARQNVGVRQVFEAATQAALQGGRMPTEGRKRRHRCVVV